jgi:hypothetical protein
MSVPQKRARNDDAQERAFDDERHKQPRGDVGDDDDDGTEELVVIRGERAVDVESEGGSDVDDDDDDDDGDDGDDNDGDDDGTETSDRDLVWSDNVQHSLLSLNKVLNRTTKRVAVLEDRYRELARRQGPQAGAAPVAALVAAVPIAADAGLAQLIDQGAETLALRLWRVCFGRVFFFCFGFIVPAGLVVLFI